MENNILRETHVNICKILKIQLAFNLTFYIYFAIAFLFINNLCHAKDQEYYGCWKSNVIDSTSYSYTFHRDGKIRVEGRNGCENFVVTGNYKIVELNNGEYLLDYTVFSVIKNGKPFILKEFNNIYNYGVIKINNEKMIIKTRGSRKADSSQRPRVDGAGVPLVLTKESVSPK